MSRFDISISLLALLTGCSGGPSSKEGLAAPISARATEAASLFGRFCLEEPPTFISVDRRATDSGFPIFLERPIAPGSSQKEWLVSISDKEAPLLLSVEAGISADRKSDVTVCGVSATEAPGIDLQQALSTDSRLGQPVRQVGQMPNGGKAVYWTPQFGGAPQAGQAQVMLAYDVPGLGVNPINVTFKHPR